MTTIVVDDVYLTKYTFNENDIIENVNCNNAKWQNDSLYEAFNGCSNLQTVTNINENVTNMGYAFYNCHNLITPPETPANVTDMSRAYYFCNNMSTTPNVPNTVTCLAGAFQWCENMPTFPDISHTNVSGYNLSGAFTGCNEAVGHVTIPYGVTEINSLFDRCFNLGSVTIPSSVLYMDRAFENCHAFDGNITIPNGVTSLYGTFQYCSNLVNAPSIPATVTNMYETFQGCDRLVNAPIIPSNVDNMGRTFISCSNLVNAPRIPSNVDNMYQTFAWCNNLGGNIYIESEKVGSAGMCFYGSNTKNVYIPMYTKEDSTETYYCFQGTEMGQIYIKGYVNTNIQDADIPALYDSSLNPITGYIVRYYNYGSPTLNCIRIAGWTFLNSTYNTEGDIAINTPAGSDTLTFKSFKAAGYDTEGTTNGVYLKNIDREVEIDETEYQYTVNNDIITLTNYIGSNTTTTIPNM